MPVQSYAPSISSHISHGSVRRLSNVLIPGYERSERLELPNPASYSRQIIPLEPDFSPVSDPSVMMSLLIQLIYLSPDLLGRISQKESINLKREEDIDRPLLLFLLLDQTLSSSRRKKNSKEI